ncbi:mycothiol synthase [Hoyosella sp. G463]|uniref:Mycothiol acetyltransferase n=1 Tax=Lolliginicoccus lacisalsi TaxID=2742202 RepID=A0A927JCF9_9ACTN|nr:mycothiol synthase [Lolliginicoccus lacisalsi]MBD8505857.1 mycothiol synthase [Lolliginicoccus lacisalsi]
MEIVPLDQDREAEVAAMLGAARDHDQVDPVSEQGLRALAGEIESRNVAVVDDGAVVGVAPVRWENGTANVELVVHPGERRRGVGSKLLSAIRAITGTGAQVWSHGDLAAARAMAGVRGLARTRELLQMRRPLGQGAQPLPDPAPLEGARITTYADLGADAQALDSEIVRVNNAAFAWHPEQGGWTTNDVQERRGLPWFDPRGLLLAVDEDDPARLLGFHWTKVHPADATEPAKGEVYIVGVDPDAHGRGVGRSLTLEGLRYLQDQGLAAVILYVESDNTAALRTYEGLGFERFFTDVAYTLG